MNIAHREHSGLYDCMDCHGADLDTHGRCARCGSDSISEGPSIVPDESIRYRLRQIQVRLDAVILCTRPFVVSKRADSELLENVRDLQWALKQIRTMLN